MINSWYHVNNGKWCYSLNDSTLRVTLRIANSDFQKVEIFYDDPFNWSNQNGIFAWERRYSKVMHERFRDESHTYLQSDLQNLRRRFKYYFKITKQDGEVEYLLATCQYYKKDIPLNFDWHKNAFSYGYVEKGKIFSVPEWVNQTVWYQIFPDRFCNGDQSNDSKETFDWYQENVQGSNPFYGGDLKGIISKIDYIKKLGCNGIYLNPIFLAQSNHKYDTTDYFKIDPQFGTMEDFDNLIRTCRKQNIKVMIDGVFNHCGEGFFAWQDVLKNREKSIYVDWFFIKDIDQIQNFDQYLKKHNEPPYDTFATVAKMPRLNWLNPDCCQYLLKIVDFWSQKGIDGWRLDVADEPSFVFWRKFRQLIDNKHPNIFILGEIWYDGSDFLRGDMFHSTMNYLIKDPIENYFGKKAISTQQFINAYQRAMFVYDDNVNRSLFNLLSSHDVERFLSYCDNDIDRYISAYTFLLMTKGTPSIYYGDEIALGGQGEFSIRRPMPWRDFSQKEPIFLQFQKLIAIRKQFLPSIQKIPQIKIINQNFFSLEYDELIVVFNNSNKNEKNYYNLPILFSSKEINGQMLQSNSVAIYKKEL